MPPGLPAPGVGSIAGQQATLATRYQQALANLDANPALAARDSDPAAAARYNAARGAIEQTYRSNDLQLTAQLKALTEQRNAVADDYVKRMMAGPADAGIVKEIGDDPRLDRETRENLWNAYTAHLKNTANGELATYGPKFFDISRRMLLPPNDPNHIGDPSQIYRLAAPKPDGTQDITLAGAEKLTGELKSLQQTPGVETFQKRRLDLIKNITLMITRSNPLVGATDPEGDAQLYNFEWALDRKISEYRAQGKAPDTLLNPTSPDFVGNPKFLSQFQTSMQQSIRSRAARMTQAPTWPQPPALAAEGAPVATAPIPPNGIAPRRTGESVSDYMKRVGLGLPAPPPQAPLAQP